MNELTQERHEQITTALGLLSAILKAGGELSFNVTDMAMAGYEYSLNAEKDGEVWTFKATKKALASKL